MVWVGEGGLRGAVLCCVVCGGFFGDGVRVGVGVGGEGRLCEWWLCEWWLCEWWLFGGWRRGGGVWGRR